MTEDKRPKTAIPSAESFSAPEAAGYLFKIIHEGWLRKRWRKRYCVLSNGILYFYEFKTSDGTEKTCSSLNLKSFGQCIIAPKKECKKSPNTFILEPTKVKNDSKDATKKVVREFLYTETPEEREKWVAKLQEAISLTSIGGKAKLTHVTKTRARPPGGGNRRPPTKQHLRERAIMSEVGLEGVNEEAKENGSSKTRGHKPTNALKPAPGMKPKVPKASAKRKTDNEEIEEEMKSSATEASTLDLPSPPPTPKSPTPPPAALKPTSIKRMPVSETDSLNSGEDSHSGSPVKETDTVIDRVSISSNSSLRKDESPQLEESNEPSEHSISDLNGSKQPAVEIVNSDTDSHKEHSSSPSRDKDDSSPTKSSPQILKLRGQLDFNFLNVNGQLRTEDRMEKAKSMMELDVDTSLPPPPSPPPESPNEDMEHKDGKKGKKGKKKKKVRPSSLVFSI